MGASTFITFAQGNTAQDAFRAAREEALYEHGHSGYTGSIAEAHSFLILSDNGASLKARLRTAIDGLKDWVREVRAGRMIQPREVETLAGRVGFEIAFSTADSTTHALATLRGQIDRLRTIERRCRVRMKPELLADALLELNDRRIREKRGPAGCIDCTPKRKRDKEFLFFGWAPT
jgi:hypothetical protein